jgi:hypothetical protein
MSGNNTEVTWLGLNFGDQSSKDKRMFSCPDPIAIAPYSFKVCAPQDTHAHAQAHAEAGLVCARR